MESLWHGGAPDRSVGDLLLPPTATGLVHTSAALSLQEGLSEIAYRPNLVYLTSDRKLARCYAAFWSFEKSRKGNGWLYRVQVDESELSPDEDLLSSPGLSFQCQSARVTGVYEKAVMYGPWVDRYLSRVIAEHEKNRAGKLA